MTKTIRLVILSGLVLAGAVGIGAAPGAIEPDATGWDAKAAAKYLDARAEFWSTWPNAARDRGTFCISCHTTLPFAIARPALRGPLGEQQPSPAESKILNNLLTRARNWREIEPFYPDQTRGIPKTSESRAIEAVMNALVLSRRDARDGHLSEDARTQLGVMWALQMKTGPNNGAWTWLNFNYEPWESPNSPYFGASLAALAVGSAPDGYAATPEIQDNLKGLRGYFNREHGKVSVLNQLMGIWASAKISNLLTDEQRKTTIDAASALQQPDGGWSTSSLGTFTRVDNTANDTSSDGYATALATLALQEAGVARTDARVVKGLEWLRRNQDRATGRWIATSLNKNRDPESEPAKFMNDAATAYAVLALTYEPAQALGNPIVTGPIPSPGTPGSAARDYIFYSTPMDLKRAGYVEQEYFLSGTATRYVIPPGAGEPTSPGTMPYRTRIVVRRPATAARFTGVVVVDWSNASSGHDTDGGWAIAGEFFVRNGWAWVGASVQQVNVHGFPPPHPMASTALKPWNPSRYGQLDLTNGGTVTDDSQSLDVYSQVAEAIRHPGAVDPFDGLHVQRVYASGGSQSARYLVRYYNYIQPRTNLFDGFLATMGGDAPRLDQRAKMFKVYTESDVARQAPVRVADSNTTHTWEIAGAPHMPSSWQSPDPRDYRAIAGGIATRDLGALGTLPAVDCARPYPSPVENWMVITAAYAALDRWVTTNTAPATTMTIQTSPGTDPAVHTIRRDVRGIAVGGIRLPAVAVPTAVDTGLNQPAGPSPQNGVCAFFGSHAPFEAATLKALYPDRAAYMREVGRVVDDLVKQNVVLKEDAATLLKRAEEALPEH